MPKTTPTKASTRRNARCRTCEKKHERCSGCEHPECDNVEIRPHCDNCHIHKEKISSCNRYTPYNPPTKRPSGQGLPPPAHIAVDDPYDSPSPLGSSEDMEAMEGLFGELPPEESADDDDAFLAIDPVMTEDEIFPVEARVFETFPVPASEMINDDDDDNNLLLLQRSAMDISPIMSFSAEKQKRVKISKIVFKNGAWNYGLTISSGVTKPWKKVVPADYLRSRKDLKSLVEKVHKRANDAIAEEFVADNPVGPTAEQMQEHLRPIEEERDALKGQFDEALVQIGDRLRHETEIEKERDALKEQLEKAQVENVDALKRETKLALEIAETKKHAEISKTSLYEAQQVAKTEILKLKEQRETEIKGLEDDIVQSQNVVNENIGRVHTIISLLSGWASTQKKTADEVKKQAQVFVDDVVEKSRLITSTLEDELQTIDTLRDNISKVMSDEQTETPLPSDTVPHVDQEICGPPPSISSLDEFERYTLTN